MTTEHKAALPYLMDGTRYKIAPDGTFTFPRELGGKWVALVDATDNRHMLAAPCVAPEAVRGLVAKWRERADKLDEKAQVLRYDGSAAQARKIEANASYLRACADELERALTAAPVNLEKVSEGFIGAAPEGRDAGLRKLLKWVGEVHPATNAASGAIVEMTWDEFNAMREAVGLKPIRPGKRKSVVVGRDHFVTLEDHYEATADKAAAPASGEAQDRKRYYTLDEVRFSRWHKDNPNGTVEQAFAAGYDMGEKVTERAVQLKAELGITPADDAGKDAECNGGEHEFVEFCVACGKPNIGGDE